MQRISIIAIIIVSLCCVAAVTQAAQRSSVGASIDSNCMMKRGTIVVPAGKTATNFQATMSSGWIPCGGASTPTRIGVRIPGYFYRVQYYKGKTETLQGNLATLTLGPGTYTVEVPDGGKNTTASVSYELKGGTPPSAPPATAGATAGGLSGEWSDPSVGSKARITHTGNSISITNTFMWQGKPVTWTGTGTVSGSKVTFNYTYTQNRPDKWEDGTMNLAIVGPGMLSGSWTTKPSGFSQKISFVQKKSDKKPVAAKPASAPKPAAKPAQNKPAAKPAVQQQNPCPPNMVHRGGGECIPRYIKVEER